MEKNKWKNVAVIETIVVVVALIFVVGFLIGKSAGNKDKTANAVSSVSDNTVNSDTESSTDNSSTNAVQETTSSEQTTAANEQANTFTLKEEIKDLDVTFDLTTQWGDSSKYYYSYTVIFENKSDTDVEDWGIVVSVPEDFEMSSAWNTQWELEDGKLYLSPVDFNKVIAGNSKVESVGFIAASKDEIDFSKAQIGVPEADAADGEEGDKSGDGKASKTTTDTASKAEYYGKLSVEGTSLVDKNGKTVQLHGVSTHGLAWYPEYVNYDSFKTLRDDYNVNLIRLAMYTSESGGYCTDGNKEELKQLIDEGVGYAKELDMYVIIDWHILNDGDPNTYKSQAKEFFEEMSKKYASYDNVIYEICNEPNGSVSWSTIKSYANEIIPVIRKNTKDAIILVGTPNWSQNVDEAAKDPLTGYSNIMYTLHFYAATHKDDLRNKLTSALNSGLPIFISEFSICDASGNGGIDYESANAWLELINKNKISYVAWSLSNKNETSALLKSTSSRTSGYESSDLSDAGKWLFETFE